MRLIDADALMEKLEERYNFFVIEYGYRDQYTSGFGDAVDKVEAAPTIDAVPVVRCKDCKYWNKRYEAMGMCMKHNAIVTFTKPDFYCAWGERKQK